MENVAGTDRVSFQIHGNKKLVNVGEAEDRCVLSFPCLHLPAALLLLCICTMYLLCIGMCARVYTEAGRTFSTVVGSGTDARHEAAGDEEPLGNDKYFLYLFTPYIDSSRCDQMFVRSIKSMS